MIDENGSPKPVSVSVFKAHCAEQLRAVEKEGITLEITRHGKVIALVKPPEGAPDQTLGALMGAAADLMTLPCGESLEDPAWVDDDWEMHGENSTPSG